MEFPLRSGAQGKDVQQENGILGGGFHMLRSQNFQKEAFLEPRNTETHVVGQGVIEEVLFSQSWV